MLCRARCVCCHFIGLLQGSSQGFHLRHLRLIECLLLFGCLRALVQQLLAHPLHSPLFLCERLFFGGIQVSSGCSWCDEGRPYTSAALVLLLLVLRLLLRLVGWLLPNARTARRIFLIKQ